MNLLRREEPYIPNSQGPAPKRIGTPQRHRENTGYAGLASDLLKRAVKENDTAFLRSKLGRLCAEVLGVDDPEAFIERAAELAAAKP